MICDDPRAGNGTIYTAAEGSHSARVPHDSLAERVGPSGIGTAPIGVAGRGQDQGGDHRHSGDVDDAQRRQHRRRPEAQADTAQPEPQSRSVNVAVTASADVLPERRNLVGTCRDRNGVGGDRLRSPRRTVIPDRIPCGTNALAGRGRKTSLS
jgi:hypothetical protein